jgi:hypothetical protein
MPKCSVDLSLVPCFPARMEVVTRSLASSDSTGGEPGLLEKTVPRPLRGRLARHADRVISPDRAQVAFGMMRSSDREAPPGGCARVSLRSAHRLDLSQRPADERLLIALEAALEPPHPLWRGAQSRHAPPRTESRTSSLRQRGPWRHSDRTVAPLRRYRRQSD